MCLPFFRAEKPQRFLNLTVQQPIFPKLPNLHLIEFKSASQVVGAQYIDVHKSVNTKCCACTYIVYLRVPLHKKQKTDSNSRQSASIRDSIILKKWTSIQDEIGRGSISRNNEVGIF